MFSIKEILADTAHRPYDLPGGPWSYYQEWNKAVFLHWTVPRELLEQVVPAALKIDSFEGKCYVSLVAFTMEKIRPRYLPPVSVVSDFDEINIRTYIDHDGRKGVYFLNIEAGNALSSFIAKQLSDLPYEKAHLKRSANTYQSKNAKKGFYLHADFLPAQKITKKTKLDRWLTERYALYLEDQKGFYRYDIQHKEWELQQIQLQQLQLKYQFGALELNSQQVALAHYSPGVQVVAWKKEKI